MRRFIIIICVIIFGIAGVAAIPYFPELFAEIEPVIVSEDNIPIEPVITDLPIYFSHDDTFYNTQISVELTPENPEAEIYYTLDGSDPNTESKKYTKPISLACKKTEKAYTLKCIAITPDETTDIVVKSYIVGTNVFSRFDEETLVFVLSTDPYNLYDYNYGIAVEGYLRDKYLKEDYTGGEIKPTDPANFNMRGRESEREMYVEVYNSEGEQLLVQAAGARVVGAYSRAVNQKSFRLIARTDYSEKGMFKNVFFPNALNSDGQQILKVDRITLRNNGNDREFAAIRDEVSLELAKQAGFPDTMEARPAAVFLNGEYYGFAWCKESYCNGYLEQMYGGVKEKYQIVSNTEDCTSGEEFAVADYQEMLDLARLATESENEAEMFTNDDVFDKFCNMVDIDNLMLYYAIQIYVDNKDWPGNNFKAWRYYADEDEEITNQFNDGKWRFLLFDAEYAWSLYGNNNRLYKDNTLKNVLSGNHMGGKSTILNAVLQRDDMKEKFSNTMCDLISGAFSSENATKVINNIIGRCEDESNYALDNGYTSSWAGRNSVNDSRSQVKQFAKLRRTVMLAGMKTVFDISTECRMYTVTLTNASGAETRLNTQKITVGGDSVTGAYFEVYETEISTSPYSGYEFDYWEINGVNYYEQVMKVNSSMADGNYAVNVVLHLKKIIDEQPIYISEICTGGDADWIEIYNPNNIPVTTKNYYLTDDPELLTKWKMPIVTIQPETAIIITTKNNKSTDSLKKLQTNFSLKEDETLILSDSNGEIISSAVIIDTDEKESLVRQTDGRYMIRRSSPLAHIE